MGFWERMKGEWRVAIAETKDELSAARQKIDAAAEKIRSTRVANVVVSRAHDAKTAVDNKLQDPNYIAPTAELSANDLFLLDELTRFYFPPTKKELRGQTTWTETDFRRIVRQRFERYLAAEKKRRYKVFFQLHDSTPENHEKFEKEEKIKMSPALRRFLSNPDLYHKKAGDNSDLIPLNPNQPAPTGRSFNGYPLPPPPRPLPKTKAPPPRAVQPAPLSPASAPTWSRAGQFTPTRTAPRQPTKTKPAAIDDAAREAAFHAATEVTGADIAADPTTPTPLENEEVDATAHIAETEIITIPITSKNLVEWTTWLPSLNFDALTQEDKAALEELERLTRTVDKNRGQLLTAYLQRERPALSDALKNYTLTSASLEFNLRILEIMLALENYFTPSAAPKSAPPSASPAKTPPDDSFNPIFDLGITMLEAEQQAGEGVVLPEIHAASTTDEHPPAFVLPPDVHDVPTTDRDDYEEPARPDVIEDDDAIDDAMPPTPTAPEPAGETTPSPDAETTRETTPPTEIKLGDVVLGTFDETNEVFYSKKGIKMDMKCPELGSCKIITSADQKTCWIEYDHAGFYIEIEKQQDGAIFCVLSSQRDAGKKFSSAEVDSGLVSFLKEYKKQANKKFEEAKKWWEANPELTRRMEMLSNSLASIVGYENRKQHIVNFCVQFDFDVASILNDYPAAFTLLETAIKTKDIKGWVINRAKQAAEPLSAKIYATAQARFTTIKNQIDDGNRENEAIVNLQTLLDEAKRDLNEGYFILALRELRTIIKALDAFEKTVTTASANEPPDEPPPEPPESPAEALERKKAEVLQKIIRTGKLMIKDDHESSREFRATVDACFRGVNDFASNVNPLIYPQGDNLMTLTQRGINEVVAVYPAALQIESTRFNNLKYNDRTSTQTPETAQELAYILRYDFLLPDLKKYHNLHQRQSTHHLRFAIFLPQSVASDAYRLIPLDPLFIRQIIAQLWEKTADNKKTTIGVNEPWTPEVWQDWLKKHTETTKLYINELGGVDSALKPGHIRAINPEPAAQP